MSTPRPAAVVVLAAGEGTRMKSSTPKVLHTVLGRSLLAHVLAAVAPLDAESTVVVIGHGREAVSAHLRGVAPEALEVVQDDQNGTGHAVRLALEAVPDAVGSVVVVCGDTPLLQAEALGALVSQHAEHGCAATVLTASLEDATGYGRIVRNSDGRVAAIVEH
ncbi:MAG: NTP transferase domain-containing protein, partial [Actinomycetes bacterium]